jgi:predicted RNase H-like nuclease (RuvC/YqgF family)
MLTTIMSGLGVGGLALILVAIVKFFENRQTLKSGAPKVSAEAFDLGIDSQNKVIERLNAENKRLSDRLIEVEHRADDLEAELSSTRKLMADANNKIDELIRVQQNLRRELDGNKL